MERKVPRGICLAPAGTMTVSLGVAGHAVLDVAASPRDECKARVFEGHDDLLRRVELRRHA